MVDFRAAMSRAIPMILARIDKPIGPFTSAVAAWDYVLGEWPGDEGSG